LSFDLLFRLLSDQITTGINNSERIPPASESMAKLKFATIKPDSAPPDAPSNAINTSIFPCVFARVAGCVPSIMSTVPLIQNLNQNNSSSTHDLLVKLVVP
jgi:hypothetical protein